MTSRTGATSPVDPPDPPSDLGPAADPPVAGPAGRDDGGSTPAGVDDRRTVDRRRALGTGLKIAGSVGALGMVAAITTVIARANVDTGLRPPAAPPGLGDPSRPAASMPVRLRTVWTGRPPGPVPQRGDEGVPIALVLANTPDPPSISTAGLEGNLPQTQASAYLQQYLGSSVRRVGARFSVGPGTSQGAVSLVGWEGREPNAGPISVAFTTAEWFCGVVVDGRVLPVEQRRHARALRPGVPYTAEALLDGDTVTLRLPDGQVRAVTDPRFAGTLAPTASWKFYRNIRGGASFVLLETWAG